MILTQLTAISPIDGRYLEKTFKLQNYFSESAFMKYKIKVEIEYFIALCKLPLPQLKTVSSEKIYCIRNIYNKFNDKDAEEIKKIEKILNHDIKALEYFIKNKFETMNMNAYKEFIHFGLTSQDINNTAIPLALKDSWNEILLPWIKQTIEELKEKAIKWKKTPMLSRTHGQPATPTTLGKEIYVFVDRIKQQIKLIKTIPFSAKFGGATGNFNAHHAAYPKINWIEFSNTFVNNILKLNRSKVTTQIEHYDCLSAFLNNLSRINTILLDLCKDMWSYISMGYFKQQKKKGEVGSSTMPHKTNPIEFENAEGNLGIANAIFNHLSSKLPISRLQRDLSDSTVIRNLGVPVAHTIIAIKSIKNGFEKLMIDKKNMSSDLENNWAVITEGIQTILRRENYKEPYELMLSLTRENPNITQKTIEDFVKTLKLSNKIKKELLAITPKNYTGLYDF